MANVFVTAGNSGVVDEAPPVKREKPMDLEGKIPGWLWSEECPAGRIIDNEKEYKQLLAMGWVQKLQDIGKVKIEPKPKPKTRRRKRVK